VCGEYRIEVFDIGVEVSGVRNASVFTDPYWNVVVELVPHLSEQLLLQSIPIAAVTIAVGFVHWFRIKMARPN